MGKLLSHASVKLILKKCLSSRQCSRMLGSAVSVAIKVKRRLHLAIPHGCVNYNNLGNLSIAE
jgi:hypothetical protein